LQVFQDEARLNHVIGGIGFEAHDEEDASGSQSVNHA
jgi:hypothetical protein